jgi:hypothetical protein
VAVASSSEQRKVAAALRSEGLSWADIAAVLRDRYGLGGLAAARQAHGWSQTRAADNWTARWPDRPITQGTISGWECWPESGRQPELRTIGRLAQLYEVAASDLLAGWADFRSYASGPLPTGYPAGVDRRTFLGVVAGAGMASALPTGSRIGAADVEALRSAMWAAWHADTQRGGAAVYADVVGQLDRVNGLLDRGSYRPTIGTQLQTLAGALTELAGFTAFDAGHQDRARQRFAEALTIAQVADDDQLTVQVLAQMAHQASFTGQGRQAVEIAQAAQRTARGFATPRLESLLAAREAVGHGLRGNTAAAEEALGRSGDELADAGDDSGAWFSYWSVLDLQAAMARTWLALGAPVAAERSAREAVEGGQVAPRAQAAYAARWAQTLVAAGQLDQAATVTVRAVEMGTGIASHRVATDLRALRPGLQGHEDVPGVPEALKALATV